MSVGFRPTDADDEIIQSHKRPGETTSDVLRRALRALDRERWQDQAREDMERIAASGEDLSEEPDDWVYDEEGRPVDWRKHHEQVYGSLPPIRWDRDAQAAAESAESAWKARRESEQGSSGGAGMFTVTSGLGSGKTEAALAAARLIKVPLSFSMPTMPPIPALPGLRLRALRPPEERTRTTSWKLAHLRAAARRASQR